MSKIYENFDAIRFSIKNLHKNFDEIINYEIGNFFEFIKNSQNLNRNVYDKLKNRVIQKYSFTEGKDNFYINFVTHAYMADVVCHILSYSITKDERHLDFFKNPNKCLDWMGVGYEDVFLNDSKFCLNYISIYTKEVIDFDRGLIFQDSLEKYIKYSSSLEGEKITSFEYVVFDDVKNGYEEVFNDIKDTCLALIVKRLHNMMDLIKTDFYSNKREIEAIYLEDKDKNYSKLNEIFESKFKKI